MMREPRFRFGLVSLNLRIPLTVAVIVCGVACDGEHAEPDKAAAARVDGARIAHADREPGNGALSERGMVSYAAELDAEESEAIRAYIIARAHESRAQAAAAARE